MDCEPLKRLLPQRRRAVEMQNIGKITEASLNSDFNDFSASPRLRGSNLWLCSRGIDLTVFFGSAVLSLILLAVGAQAGILNGDTPEWTWISAILLVDVAHVWSTSFRVYFDTEELKRRFWLYLLVPVIGYNSLKLRV